MSESPKRSTGNSDEPGVPETLRTLQRSATQYMRSGTASAAAE